MIKYECSFILTVRLQEKGSEEVANISDLTQRTVAKIQILLVKKLNERG